MRIYVGSESIHPTDTQGRQIPVVSRVLLDNFSVPPTYVEVAFVCALMFKLSGTAQSLWLSRYSDRLNEEYTAAASMALRAAPRSGNGTRRKECRPSGSAHTRAVLQSGRADRVA